MQKLGNFGICSVRSVDTAQYSGANIFPVACLYLNRFTAIPRHYWLLTTLSSMISRKTVEQGSPNGVDVRGLDSDGSI